MLQILHPPRLIDLQPAIFLAPPIQRLFRYPDLSASLDRRRPPPDQHIRLTQLRDNLLRRKTLTPHNFLQFSRHNGLSPELDQFFQGRPYSHGVRLVPTPEADRRAIARFAKSRGLPHLLWETQEELPHREDDEEIYPLMGDAPFIDTAVYSRPRDR